MKIHIKTYGCQMNVHDSEIIAGIVKKNGYKLCDDLNNADVVILNTCAIRDNAENKVYAMIGAIEKRNKRQNLNIRIIVCGCVAQKAKDDIFRRFPYVFGVVGTRDISELSNLLAECSELSENQALAVEGSEFYEPGADNITRDEKHRAWVSIVKGCENFCSYCVVPYVRGGEVSRPKNEILDEIKYLINDGVKEICLLGQNVNSYGNDLDIEYSFVNLLTDINSLKGEFRIKFVTSHPKDISLDLLYAMRDLPSLCEFLHFPCQAGSNRVLKLMNRGYTKEHYLDLVAKAREIVPNIVIGTDIIVGFPGETEEDFLETCDLSKKLAFDMAYIFKYSKRSGTKAFDMPDHIEEKEKKRRHNMLMDIQNQNCLLSNKKDVGSTQEVLIDGPSKTDASKLQGRTRGNKIVILDADTNKYVQGNLVDVKIISAGDHSLYA